ncbi:unnamed protein product [Protopolystoma xenopodis]|uniref:Uncharacterized protein n=1 Tax=Protopolystoma xenopodis TaxID=117903 RepID=A0A3S5A2H3_9PLAT|nr:unnamed protein product [Protopolystoma xenopodis]
MFVLRDSSSTAVETNILGTTSSLSRSTYPLSKEQIRARHLQERKRARRAVLNQNVRRQQRAGMKKDGRDKLQAELFLFG